jgi:hypothetical protein
MKSVGQTVQNYVIIFTGACSEKNSQFQNCSTVRARASFQIHLCGLKSSSNRPIKVPIFLLSILEILKFMFRSTETDTVFSPVYKCYGKIAFKPSYVYDNYLSILSMSSLDNLCKLFNTATSIPSRIVVDFYTISNV